MSQLRVPSLSLPHVLCRVLCQMLSLSTAPFPPGGQGGPLQPWDSVIISITPKLFNNSSIPTYCIYLGNSG